MTWEERWHPLREEWVILAAHRQDRPWSGETVGPEAATRPRYVEDCYLCPGNPRVGGAINPRYAGVFVFDNDLPCVGMNAPTPAPVVGLRNSDWGSRIEEPSAPDNPQSAFSNPQSQGVYQNRPARGIARVVCYSPRHDLSLAQLEIKEVENLISAWQGEYIDLGNRHEIDHVLIFENKGEVVGVSNPHPHCQIYATNFVFKTIEIEVNASRRYLSRTGRTLFQDIIAAEQREQTRIICENETAIAFLPYFARYAYEVFIAPKQTHPSIADLNDAEVHDFASVLKDTLVRFDNLWQMSFPYVMPLHQAPTDKGDYGGFHFHLEFHPPLRKPNLLKYLAGPEIGGGNFLSDTSPEDKAAELRAVSNVHYTEVRESVPPA